MQKNFFNGLLSGLLILFSVLIFSACGGSSENANNESGNASGGESTGEVIENESPEDKPAGASASKTTSDEANQLDYDPARPIVGKWRLHFKEIEEQSEAEKVNYQENVRKFYETNFYYFKADGSFEGYVRKDERTGKWELKEAEDGSQTLNIVFGDGEFGVTYDVRTLNAEEIILSKKAAGQHAVMTLKPYDSAPVNS